MLLLLKILNSMCLSPILVPNPNYRSRLDSLGRYRSRDDGRRHLSPYWYLHDCTSTRIYVPCGRCPQCRSRKQSDFIQRVQVECFTNYMFFCTLTYKDSELPFVEVNGFKHYFADIRDFQNMIKHIRQKDLFGRPFKFFAVNEYGGKSHRPHFHVVFLVPKYETDNVFTPFKLESEYHDIVFKYWRRNYGSDKYPVWHQLSDYVVTRKGRTYDFHHVNPSLTDKGESDVGFYVTKYLFKQDKWLKRKQQALRLNLSDECYKDVWNCIRPRLMVSKFLGVNDSSYNYVRKCIDYSTGNRFSFPVFINPVDGRTFPLSTYYKKKYLNLDDAHSFYFFTPDETGLEDSFRFSTSYTPAEVSRRLSKYGKQCEHISDTDCYEILEI